MLYHEFLELTGDRAKYEQYELFDAICLHNDGITMQQAADLWKIRFGHKNYKPLSREMRYIKSIIREHKSNRKYAKELADDIRESYAASLEEERSKVDPTLDFWSNYWVYENIKRIEGYIADDIYRLYEDYGNDATIHIIYADGSETICSGMEIVTGDITPKMQHIVYAHYMDAWDEYDTFAGTLEYDFSIEEQAIAREEYTNAIQFIFDTTWARQQMKKGA